MENPLLIMPPPTESEKDSLPPYHPAPVNRPPFDIQVDKVSPKIEEVLEQLQNKVLRIDSNPDGLIPEKILVLELKKFDLEIKKKLIEIIGFEWVFDFEEKHQESDEFYTVCKKTGERKAIDSHFYLSMANSQCLTKLKSIWDEYCENKGRVRHGYGKFKTLFEYLKDIRFWSTEDRLRNTGLYDDLIFKMENGVPEIAVEVELWHRSDEKLNNAAIERLKKNIEEFGGSVVSLFSLDAISYTALLAVFPTDCVQLFYTENLQDIDILTNDDVMFFNASSQCAVEVDELETLEESELKDSEVTLEQERPCIGLLDGYPLQGHEAIKDQLIIDDPDGFEEFYQSHQRIHGTSMASIIINGDANNIGKKIGKIYCRPIMIPDSSPSIDGLHYEVVPKHLLPVDIIHRAVKRMFEGDGELPAQADNVKVINLSIGDFRKRFEGRLSPLAKLIDWLSWKYNVLFIVSAGNYCMNIDLGMSNSEYQAMNAEEKVKETVKNIKRNIYEKRLLSPAEAINALTVGALHDDDSNYVPAGDQVDPVKVGEMPSPINTTSWGVKRSIKPDILMPGGRQIYRNRAITDSMNVELEPILFPSAPFGVKSAMPGKQGTLNTYGYTVGTSNAAALATRKAGMIYETIQDLKLVAGNHINDQHTSTVIKGLMVHSAETDELDLELYKDNNKNLLKYNITKFSGYGKLNNDRAHRCYNNQATMIRSGSFVKEEGHRHSLPLPECLSGTNHLRKLIITLSWLTPSNYSSQCYRGVKLWFRADKDTSSDNNPLQVEARELDHRQVRNGTVQHEVFVGDKGMIFAEDKELIIKVNAKGDGLKLDGSFEVPYTLIVTIETPDNQLPIYEEVKEKLRIKELEKVRAKSN